MSLHNDLLMQSEKAKFNAQQAGLSRDKRLQDMYNSTAEQLFIHGMNAKMKADEREAEYQRYYAMQYAMQEQRRHKSELPEWLFDDTSCDNNSKMSTILETVGVICGILIGCLIVF